MANEEYDIHDDEEPQYMRGHCRGFMPYFYICGDRHFTGKRILINPTYLKNHGAILDHCTKALDPPFGAVRKITTPSGRTEVRSSDDFKPDTYYIACGGKGFRGIGRSYSSIKRNPPWRCEKSPRLKSIIGPLPSSNRYQHARPRYMELADQNKAIIILVAENKKFSQKAHKVKVPIQLIKYNDLGGVLELIIRDLNYRVQCNVLMDSSNGNPVEEATQIVNNHLYVASASVEAFDNSKRYSSESMPDFKTSHSTYPTLPPISSKKHASPDTSVASHPQTRRRETRSEKNGGVQTRAVKHKRTPDKDFHSDRDNGVFKAKNQNQHTKGAKEVGDTRDTHVDLPIDQVAAEEVKEEKIGSEKKQAKGQKVTNSRKVANTKKETTQKTNSKTNPPQKTADHSHHGGGGGHQEPQKQQNSGTKGEFNKVSPLPPIQQNQNNDIRTSSPAWSDDGKSITEKENEAATKIQAHYKGYKTREGLEQQKAAMKADDNKNNDADDLKKKEEEEKKKKLEEEKKKKEEEEKKKKETEDQKKKDDAAQLQKEQQAATTIQAGFRGHMTRQEVKKQKEAAQN